MSFLRLLKVETSRLFRSKITWLVILATVLFPMVGLVVANSFTEYSVTLLTKYLMYPAMFGTVGGAIFFFILTVLELNRIHKNRTDLIIDAIISPLIGYTARFFAVVIVAIAAQIIVLSVYLPVVMIGAANIFRLTLYFGIYLTWMFPALIFGCLFGAAAYQITRRVDLSIVLFIVFCALCFTSWSESYLLRWINPPITMLSDDFGNARRVMILAFNRLFWLLILGGFWTLSLLFIRRYEKNIWGSIKQNIKKLYISLLSVILLFSGMYAFFTQPFIDKSSPEIDYSFLDNFEEIKEVSCKAIHVDARPDFKLGRQYGTALFDLQNQGGQPHTITFFLNPGYRVYDVTANGVSIPFRDLNDDNMGEKNIEIDLPAIEDIKLAIEYGGFPTEWSITEMFQGELEISEESFYLANSDFAPKPKDFGFGNYYQDIDYTIDMTLPEGMYPLLFGTGTSEAVSTNKDGSVNWHLTDKGTTRALVYGGDYVSNIINAASLDVEFYYSAKHEEVLKRLNVDQVIKNVFEYCTDKIGPLSFYSDTGMRLIEAGFGGGYAGDGCSLMGEESFNETGLNDTNRGAGGDEVLAHEIIHQWWGLGNMFDFEKNSPWSPEGLTVYTTYRLMKELHGEKYVQTHYIEQWQRSVKSYYNNFYVRNPQYLHALPEQYQYKISNSLASVRHYSEMPLKILKAEKLVGGEEAFDEIIQNLFNREIDPLYPYLSYDVFLTACGLSEEDLNLD